MGDELNVHINDGTFTAAVTKITEDKREEKDGR